MCFGKVEDISWWPRPLNPNEDDKKRPFFTYKMKRGDGMGWSGTLYYICMITGKLKKKKEKKNRWTHLTKKNKQTVSKLMTSKLNK